MSGKLTAADYFTQAKVDYSGVADPNLRKVYERFEKIQLYLADLFVKFIDDVQVIPILLHIENVKKYWSPAFTTISVSPADGTNYEVFEIVGDRAIELAFLDMLRKIIPLGTESLFTSLKNYYLSNEYLATRAKALGMDTILAYLDEREVTDKMLADIYEAFTYALMSCADSALRGYGFPLVYNFFVWDFSHITIDLTKGGGAARSNVEQIFDRFKVETPKPDIDPNPKRDKGGNVYYTASVSLNRNQITFLNEKGRAGISAPTLLLAYGNGKTTDAAVQDAFARAEKKLANDYGIDTNWAISYKNKIELSQPGIKPYVSKALAAAAPLGVTHITFRIPSKSDDANGMMVILVGKKSNGVDVTLKGKYYVKNQGGHSTAFQRECMSDLIKRYVEESGSS